MENPVHFAKYSHAGNIIYSPKRVLNLFRRSANLPLSPFFHKIIFSREVSANAFEERMRFLQHFSTLRATIPQVTTY